MRRFFLPSVLVLVFIFGVAAQETFTSLHLSDYLSHGASPAETGAIRLSNADEITSRNSTDTTDLPLITAQNDDTVLVANSILIRPTVGVILMSQLGELGNPVWAYLGQVWMPYLPTSNPHVVGQLWNDNGTLKISAGP